MTLNRNTFIGEFDRIQCKHTYKCYTKKTVLLKNIKTNDGFFWQHVWINYTPEIEKLGFMRKGIKIKFDASIRQNRLVYIKNVSIYNKENLSFDKARQEALEEKPPEIRIRRKKYGKEEALLRLIKKQKKDMKSGN